MTLCTTRRYDGMLYSDRGVAGVRLDGDTETLLDCRVNTRFRPRHPAAPAHRRSRPEHIRL